MNGANYGTFNIDASTSILEYNDFGGGGSSNAAPAQENQPLHHGPQGQNYDPSASAPAAQALNTYNSAVANAPGIRQQQQQQQQQQQLILAAAAGAAVNDYLPREQQILTTFMGAAAAAGGAPAAPAFGQRTNTNQYQRLSPNPFDPLPIALSHPTTGTTAAAAAAPAQAHSPNPFDDLLLSAFVNQQQQQQQQQPAAPGAADVSSLNGTFSAAVPTPPNDPQHEPWLEEIKITVSSLSLEPLSGAEVMTRMQTRMDDVITKYLPCVDFLVQCQQDLRKGLVHAQRKVGSSRRYFQQGMSPRQFWTNFVEPLPRRFLLKNQHVMDTTTLNTAVSALEQLRTDAKSSCETSCEAVKNSFLGGMKEGESWGLRRWLSKHGNALAVCTDMECILKSLKSLDKKADTTKKLAALIRPLAGRTLSRLKNDVPPSYQERSSAHPYLPFFHRLEGALRDASQFDPEDDGVICLEDSDDDSDDVVEVLKPPPKPSGRKRKAQDPPARIEPATIQPFAASPGAPQGDDASSSGDEAPGEIVEVVGVKDNAADPDPDPLPVNWRCQSCSNLNKGTDVACTVCGDENNGNVGLFGVAGGEMDQLFNNESLAEAIEEEIPAPPPKKTPPKKKRRKAAPKAKGNTEADRTSHLWPTPATAEEIQAATGNTLAVAAKLENLAIYFRENREAEVRPPVVAASPFWNKERYADALQLFGNLLQRPDAIHFMENVSDDLLMNANPDKSRYSHIIKNPLCFRDIASSLLSDMVEGTPFGQGDGRLPRGGLSSWNMWKGIDLLQAIDLVFLNSLAYGREVGEKRSRQRARTNELRKFFWSRISAILDEHAKDDPERRRQWTPTRRSEKSGFVVFKYNSAER